MNDKNLLENSTHISEVNVLRSAAECLKSYLSTHGEAGRQYEILHFLANQTILNIDQNKQTNFTNVSIKDAVSKVDSDASAWLSPLWKKLTNETLPKRRLGLQEFAINNGYTHYPWIDKTDSSGGAGNQSTYRLIALPIDEKIYIEAQEKPNVEYDLSYISAEQVKPSWITRLLFDRDYTATGWRKNILILVFPLFWIIFGILLIWLMFMTLNIRNTALTTRDVAWIASFGGMIFYCYKVFTKWLHLVDDRIVMASDSFIGFKEMNVTLEMITVYDENKNLLPRKLQLIKYASVCPICDAEVLLDEGEPDFPRRIVGRCKESPREHVFSFDRITKTGKSLR